MWGALVNHSPKENADAEQPRYVAPFDRMLTLPKRACLKFKMNMNGLKRTSSTN